jgi:periplasmic protein TonB
MASNHFMESKWIDLIFEGKNKSYGAYILRQNYDSSIKRALILGVFFFVFCSFVPGYFYNAPDKVVDYSGPGGCGWVELSKYKKVEEKCKKIVYRKRPKGPLKFVPPIVTEDYIIKYYDLKAKKDTIAIAQLESIMMSEVKSIENIPQLIEKSEPIFDDGVGCVAAFQILEPTFGKFTKIETIHWIQQQIKYPEFALEKGLEGEVLVSFVINKQGKVENVKIIKDDVGGGCAEAAVKVIENMPEWTPGKQNGNNVKVKVTIPILFKLEQK